MTIETHKKDEHGSRQLPVVLRCCAADRREWRLRGAGAHLAIPAPLSREPMRLVGVGIALVGRDIGQAQVPHAVCSEHRLDFCRSRRGGLAHYVRKFRNTKGGDVR